MKKRWEDKKYRENMKKKHTGKRGYKYKKHIKPLRLNLDIEDINNLYKKGWSIYKIAKNKKVCWTAIKKRIKE